MWWGTVAVAMAAVSVACGTREAPPLRPNVLLVTLDTTRADRLGSYGYAQASTPTLDRLSAEGVRFERALSPVPLTLPAHASLLTGRNPYAHGVRNNGHFVLPPDVPTLAATFGEAGYDTAAFVSSFVLDRQFGLARGFAHYDDALDPAPSTSGTTLELERRGDRTVAAATAWMRERVRGAGDRPYFVWVHLYDPHDPYTPPAPYAERFASQPYDGEIAFMDAQIATLLAAASGAGSFGPPFVVVAGDHGESLGEHGESAHGLFVYEGAIRVPLIVSWPGHLKARVVRTPVRLIDVAPTVAALAGLSAMPGVDGRDVTPLTRDANSTMPAALAYSETYFPELFMGWAPLRAVDDGRWKYIDSPEPELYDVAADPGETSNRYSTEPATARALRRQLEQLARAADRTSAAPVSAEAQRKLAALGYVSTPSKPAGAAAPTPRRMVGVFERLTSGNRALAEDRAQDAVRTARDVLREDPNNLFAHLVLGRGLLATGDGKGAVAALSRYLQAVPGSADAHHWLALAHLRLDDRDKALSEEEAAIALDPRHAAAIALRAGLIFSRGRVDEGLESLRAAVDAQPAHLGLRTDFADLLTDARRYDDARAQYRSVLDQRPDDTRALSGLGLVLSREGQRDEAIRVYTRALEADPRLEEARIERASLYAQLGRVTDARADLERLTGPEVRPDIRRAAQRGLRELAPK